jgi:diguanylate cyclase (GGDEF)-like protein
MNEKKQIDLNVVLNDPQVGLFFYNGLNDTIMVDMRLIELFSLENTIPMIWFSNNENHELDYLFSEFSLKEATENKKVSTGNYHLSFYPSSINEEGKVESGYGLAYNYKDYQTKNKECSEMNEIFKSSQLISGISVWWVKIDESVDYYYHTDEGTKEFGIEIRKDKRYEMDLFNQMMGKAIETYPEYTGYVNEANRLFSQCMEGKINSYSVKYPIITFNEELKWIHAKGKTIKYDSEGKPLFFVGVDLDVTNEINSKNEIEELKQLVDNGLSSSHIGTWWVKNGINQEIHFSPMAKYLLGYSYSSDFDFFDERVYARERLLRKYPEYQEYIDYETKAFNQVYSGEIEMTSVIVPVLHRDDTLLWVESRMSVVSRGKQRVPDLIVGAVIDITEQQKEKEEKEKLIQKNKSLETAYQTVLDVGNVMYFKIDFFEDGSVKGFAGNDLLHENLGIDSNANELTQYRYYADTYSYKVEHAEYLEEFMAYKDRLYDDQIDQFTKVICVHRNLNTDKYFYFEHSVQVHERYDSHQIKSVVGFLLDVTDRILNTQKIKKLAEVDRLTGIYNRHVFDEYVLNGKFPRTYTVIIFDLDGLKLINDTLGHFKGDEFILMAARTIGDTFRNNNLFARIGGDEFIVITELSNANLLDTLLDDISQKISDFSKKDFVESGISSGYEIVEERKINFENAFVSAENKMYRSKLNRRNSRKAEALQNLLVNLYATTDETVDHGERVGDLLARLYKESGRSRRSEIEDMKLIGKLHDLGKITISDEIWKKEKFDENDYLEMKKHAESGFKIISSILTSDVVSKAILHHHERFDGTGYPFKLKGTDIPLEARMLAIVEAYDALTSGRVYKKARTIKEALEEIILHKNTQFDPELVNLFVELIKRKYKYLDMPET